MNKYKKITSLVLTLLMIITILPFNVFARNNSGGPGEIASDSDAGKQLKVTVNPTSITSGQATNVTVTLPDGKAAEATVTLTADNGVTLNTSTITIPASTNSVSQSVTVTIDGTESKTVTLKATASTYTEGTATITVNPVTQGPSPVENYTISPSNPSVQKGKTQQFILKNNENEVKDGITWSVSGDKSSITGGGLLSVASDETASKLTVTANVGNKKVATTVTVTEPSKTTYTLKFDDRDDIEYVKIGDNSRDYSIDRSYDVEKGKTVEVKAYEHDNNNSDKNTFSRWEGVSSDDYLNNYDKYDRTTKFKMNDDITLKAKYSDDSSSSLKRVYPTDKEKDGNYRVKGKLSDYTNTKVYVYYDGKEIGSGWTDSNGYFNISTSKNIDGKMSDLKFYVNENAISGDYTRVYPKNVELYNKRNGEYRDVKGKLADYTDTKIYVYHDDKEIGSGWTDSNGKFDFRLSKYLDDKYDESDLKFYVKNKDSKPKNTVLITNGLPGAKFVSGVDAGKQADLKVKDSKGNLLGTGTANDSGSFTVALNRALIGGETITVYAKVTGQAETMGSYIVPNEGGNVVATQKGYIKGFPDGQFKPDNNMTRAEAIAMIARLKNKSDNFTTSEVTKFIDSNYKWYSKALNYAVQQNLVVGSGDSRFRPDDKITRAEFTKMLVNEVNGIATDAPFADIQGHWAKASISKLYNAKIISGFPDGQFKPNAYLTRAEAVKMLNGVYNVKASDYTKKFSDVYAGQWFYEDVMKAANTTNF